MSKADIPKRWYRPELQFCPTCGRLLKRHHILWRKRLFLLSGAVDAVSWGYACVNLSCSGAHGMHGSVEAEQLHLKYRRYSRELIIQIGYRRFWQHQTMYEIHQWLALGGEGVIAENNRDEQRKVIKYNHLVANCVIFYNVHAVSRLLRSLKGEGYQIEPEGLLGVGMQFTTLWKSFTTSSLLAVSLLSDKKCSVAVRTCAGYPCHPR